MKLIISAQNGYFLLLFLLLFSPTSWALRTDSTQPAYFLAERVVFNHKTGTTTFIGQVKMEQGTTHLTADKVIAYKDRQGQFTKIIASGELAHYSTLPDNQTKILDAYGEIIEYYPQDKKAVILGKANVIQAPNSFNGEHLVYDMAKQVVTSFPTATKSPSLMILMPQTLPGNP